jgi:phosphatidylglycerophosphate synthase
VTGSGQCALLLGSNPVRIWGMSSEERLRRTFVRCSLELAPSLDSLPKGSRVVMAHAGWVFDENLIRTLAGRADTVLTDARGQPVAASVSGEHAALAASALTGGLQEILSHLNRLNVEELAYNSALRKRETPVLEPLTASNASAIEDRLFKASYKGVTDLVTKYIWPVPAQHVTRWCALAGITPNQVTFASLLLVIVTFVLFWRGEFAFGLVAAWFMTFLDTVDGKLARVTLTSSKIGNVFDHGIDLVHPPFWWWAWFVGTAGAGFVIAPASPVLWIVLGGYVVQRVEEGIFMRLFGMHMHAWRPFDSFFRLITARRNPNLLILTASTLAERPDLGFVAIAAWTVICLAVHLLQIVQALAAPRPLVSWMAR